MTGVQTCALPILNVAEDGENTVALGLGRILTDNKFRQYGYTMRSRIYS